MQYGCSTIWVDSFSLKLLCASHLPHHFRALAHDSYVGNVRHILYRQPWVPTRVTHFGHYDPISVAIIRTQILNASAGYCLFGRTDKNFHANYRELRPLSFLCLHLSFSLSFFLFFL